MDKETLREIWHGQLPVCFKLNQDDISGMHSPESCFMLLPRITYFPLVLDRVIKYFNRFIDQDKQTANELWLDYDGQPVKWQHPIGLSWDLLGSEYCLPWTLTLHYSDFPAKQLVRCNTKASIKTIFMSSLKEADALKHKGAVITNIVEKEQNQLWSGLQNHKFDQFWKINQRLMERIDNKLFRSIPFRIYFPDYTYIQKSIKPCENPETTMLDLIQITFVDRLDDLLINNNSTTSSISNQQITTTASDELAEQQDTEEKSPDDGGEGTDGGLDNENVIENRQTNANNDRPPSYDGRAPQTGCIDVENFKYRFITQGIEIPFETPLQWLSEHLSYPDNFLHICAVLKE